LVNAGLCENEQMVNKNETAAPKAPAAKSAAKPAAPKAAPKPAPKPAAKVAPVTEAPKRYRLLTGVDDSAFCQKVSDALDSGYELYGSPSVTFNGTNVIAAQAVILKKLPKKSKK
jgi:hypothetical protein